MWIAFDHGSSSQKDLPQIKLYGCSFANLWEVQFKLYALMTLIGCEFKRDFEDTFLTFWLLKRHNESEITAEYPSVIEIIQTRIEVPYVGVQIDYVKGSLQIVNADLNVSKFYIDIGREKLNDFTPSFELSVTNCKIAASFVTCVGLLNSYGIFTFENTVFEEIIFESLQCAGVTGLTFNKCSFNNALHVEIQNFAYFGMLESSVNVPNVCEGRDCAIYLTGVHYSRFPCYVEIIHRFFKCLEETTSCSFKY